MADSNFKFYIFLCIQGLPPLENKGVEQRISSLFPDSKRFKNFSLNCSTKKCDPLSLNCSTKESDQLSPKLDYSRGDATGSNDHIREWIKNNVRAGDVIGLLVFGEKGNQMTMFVFAHQNTESLMYGGRDIASRRYLKNFMSNKTITFVVDQSTNEKLNVLGLEVGHRVVLDTCGVNTFAGISEEEVGDIGSFQYSQKLSNYCRAKAFWLCLDWLTHPNNKKDKEEAKADEPEAEEDVEEAEAEEDEAEEDVEEAEEDEAEEDVEEEEAEEEEDEAEA